ncbi:hypothetical protein ARMSODRAFT_131751 [Armillaria solidipes]|uniref:Uncharacterized protein n=1 Tax=Armillaria solidipes TaxID=1076256 RepID=A0A2H3BW21_9AGAR|nr:hypothetical protein ARMSODRAFT_131751 [Armillaria solidipes]
MSVVSGPLLRLALSQAQSECITSQSQQYADMFPLNSSAPTRVHFLKVQPFPATELLCRRRRSLTQRAESSNSYSGPLKIILLGLRPKIHYGCKFLVRADSNEIRKIRTFLVALLIVGRKVLRTDEQSLPRDISSKVQDQSPVHDVSSTIFTHAIFQTRPFSHHETSCATS